MRLYQLIFLIATPVILARMLLQIVAGRQSWQDIHERLGYSGPTDPISKCIWVHGASLGELTSARGLLDYVAESNPELHIVVTSNTITARNMVQRWNMPQVTARLAPLDSRIATRRFLSRWQPRLTFSLENELWPNRIDLCARAGISVFMIGARISARGAARWRKLPGLTRQLFAGINAVTPMDKISGDRFRQLGIDSAKITQPANLKSTVLLPAPDAAELAAIGRIFSRNETVLAASTHPGEEEIILAGFAAALAKNNRLRLIIAPRHPKRGAQISGLIAAAGFDFSRRADGAEPNIKYPVYLADTLGEMPLWFSASVITVLGGSFVDKGGHTPVEPIQFKSAIVHGPDVSNHSEIYKDLDQNDAAMNAANADEIGTTITDLIAGNRASVQAKNAQAMLANMQPNCPTPAVLLQRLDRLSGGKLAKTLLY